MMSQTRARKTAAELGPDAAWGAALERERTLAIIDCFCSPKGVPDFHKYLLGLVRERITSRCVTEVLTDPAPVIQLPAADTGPKSRL